MSKIPVALLGASGVVGQKVLRMMENHPVFEIAELIASDKNIGQNYLDICTWREDSKMPENLKNKKIVSPNEIKSQYAISSLPAETALVVEKDLAKRGVNVVSNASTYRMHANVPLLVPEINPSHLELIHDQETPGKIITNPNCSTVFLVGGLFPMLSLGKIKHVSVVTLQAVSGAGYPGLSSLDILGNNIPFIKDEEEKIEQETLKILGQAKRYADFKVTAHVNRVPVAHGHTVNMHIFYENEVDLKNAEKAIQKKIEQFPNLYVYHTDQMRPQPIKDLHSTDQRIHLGRLKMGSENNVIGLVALGHNLVRGAAGAAILNLELLHKYLGEKK